MTTEKKNLVSIILAVAVTVGVTQIFSPMVRGWVMGPTDLAELTREVRRMNDAFEKRMDLHAFRIERMDKEIYMSRERISVLEARRQRDGGQGGH